MSEAILATSYVSVDLEWHMPTLATLAGTTIQNCHIRNGNVFYAPVSQSALDSAKQTYESNPILYLSRAQWAVARKTRNKKLCDCDWTQVADVALTSSEIAQWQTYRQQLRDITTSQSDPTNITWPTEP
jgi:hypothetical protein